MSWKRHAIGTFVVLAAVTLAQGGQVWQSTFDFNADGVVDVVDNNSTKAMIGPVSGGRLQITTEDRALAFNSNDRAGRPLGATLNGNNSFSALYRFNWSTLHQGNTPVWEGFGFIGDNNNIARQAVGGLLQHRKDAEGNYFMRIGIRYAESGTGSQFYRGGEEINIGTDANVFTRDFHFAIGYDGESHVLSLGFFDDAGNLLGSMFQDLDAAVGGLTPTGNNTVQMMLDSLAVTHLGWADYTASGQNQRIVWQVDELTYFDSAVDAFDAVPNAATGACCRPDGTCEEGLSQLGCVGVGGTWGGAGSACASTICPDPIGACCAPDGACSQLTEADCTAASGAWQGGNTACTLTQCPPPPTGACCSQVDGSCQDGRTEFNCVGVWQGADTVCATTNCPPPAGGACCLSNGACITVGELACDAQCGVFQGAGTSCATAGCPQLPEGACCMPDGTCMTTLEWECPAAWRGPGTSCAEAHCREMPSLVWWSNFHTDRDGIEDVRANNPNKELIGPQCDGRLQITTRSNSPTSTDRGGRALDGTKTGNDSFSGLYRFRWSTLNETPSNAWEFAAFVGNQDNPTRQTLGAILLHNKVEVEEDEEVVENYFVRMCSAGAEATGFFLFQCGATINLGPNATERELQLAITYDGQTHLLTHALFDDAGNLLGTPAAPAFQTWDLDTQCPTDPVGCQNYFDCPTPPPGCTKQIKYDRLALTHLGWSDHFATPFVDQVWQVDSLALFSDAAGAYNALFSAEPLPSGSCCRPDGSCAEDQTELACLAVEGQWSGDGTTCATASCLGACCLPDASCMDDQTVSSCEALDGTFQGLGEPCASASCPLPPCNQPFADADGDGDVDMDDFALFQECYTGPSNTAAFRPGQCHCFDRDGDQDVDNNDFLAFIACVSGASVPADPACEGAP